MTNDPALLHRLADRFFNAIASEDSATIQEIYDPLVQVWHNHDDNTQGLAENLRLLAFMATDASGTELRVIDFGIIAGIKSFSQELRLGGNSGGLRGSSAVTSSMTKPTSLS